MKSEVHFPLPSSYRERIDYLVSKAEDRDLPSCFLCRHYKLRHVGTRWYCQCEKTKRTKSLSTMADDFWLTVEGFAIGCNMYDSMVDDDE